MQSRIIPADQLSGARKIDQRGLRQCPLHPSDDNTLRLTHDAASPGGWRAECHHDKCLFSGDAEELLRRRAPLSAEPDPLSDYVTRCRSNLFLHGLLARSAGSLGAREESLGSVPCGPVEDGQPDCAGLPRGDRQMLFAFRGQDGRVSGVSSVDLGTGERRMSRARPGAALLMSDTPAWLCEGHGALVCFDEVDLLTLHGRAHLAPNKRDRPVALLEPSDVSALSSAAVVEHAGRTWPDTRLADLWLRSEGRLMFVELRHHLKETESHHATRLMDRTVPMEGRLARSLAATLSVEGDDAALAALCAMALPPDLAERLAKACSGRLAELCRRAPELAASVVVGEHTLVRGAHGYYQITKGVRTRLTNFVMRVECYARDAEERLLMIGKLRMADSPDGERHVELPVSSLKRDGIKVAHSIWETLLESTPDAKPYALTPKGMDLLGVVRAFDSAPLKARAGKLGADKDSVTLPWLRLSEGKVERFELEPSVAPTIWRHYAAARSTDGGLDAARAIAKTLDRGSSALLSLLAHVAHQTAARTAPDATVRHLIVPCNNDGTWDNLFTKLRLTLSGSSEPVILPSSGLELKNALVKYQSSSNLPLVATYRGRAIIKQLESINFSAVLLVDRATALQLDRHPLCVFARPAVSVFDDHSVDVDDATIAKLRVAFPAMVKALIGDSRLSAEIPAEACLEAIGANMAIKTPMSKRAVENVEVEDTLWAYLELLLDNGYRIGSGAYCVTTNKDLSYVATRLDDHIYIPIARFTEALAKIGLTIDGKEMISARDETRINKHTWVIPDRREAAARKTA